MSRLLKVDNCNDCIFYCEGECDLLMKNVGYQIPDDCPLPNINDLTKKVYDTQHDLDVRGRLAVRLYNQLLKRIENLETYFKQHIQDCHKSQSRGCE